MQGYTFGPVQVALNPEFKLHDLCTAWNPACDVDLDEMISVTRTLGGIINNPVTVWKGLLLDGRNRQIVAKTLGMPLEYREFIGEYQQAYTYVLAVNLARRHLTPQQRAVMAARLADINKRNGIGDGPRVKDVSISAQVPKKTAMQAIDVVKAANESGDEAMLDRIFKGESTPHKELKALKEKPLDLRGPPIKKDRPLRDLSEEMFTDADGQVVPDCLLDVWKQVVKFSQLRIYFELGIPDLQRIMDHPTGKHLSVEHQRRVKELIRDLDAKTPNLVCPHCIGVKTCSCDLCKRRWASRGLEEKQECYCCDGDGYLIKEQPYPDTEWVKASQE